MNNPAAQCKQTALMGKMADDEIPQANLSSLQPERL
jgi:hypothetical protein